MMVAVDMLPCIQKIGTQHLDHSNLFDAQLLPSHPPIPVPFLRSPLSALSLPPQLGKTKLFLKHPETIFALEELKNGVLHSLAARIQRAWRRYISNKKYACARTR